MSAISSLSEEIKDRSEALLRAAAPLKGAEAVSLALLAEQKKTNSLLAEIVFLLREQVSLDSYPSPLRLPPDLTPIEFSVGSCPRGQR